MRMGLEYKEAFIDAYYQELIALGYDDDEAYIIANDEYGSR